MAKSKGSKSRKKATPDSRGSVTFWQRAASWWLRTTLCVLFMAVFVYIAIGQIIKTEGFASVYGQKFSEALGVPLSVGSFSMKWNADLCAHDVSVKTNGSGHAQMTVSELHVNRSIVGINRNSGWDIRLVEPVLKIQETLNGMWSPPCLADSFLCFQDMMRALGVEIEPGCSQFKVTSLPGSRGDPVRVTVVDGDIAWLSCRGDEIAHATDVQVVYHNGDVGISPVRHIAVKAGMTTWQGGGSVDSILYEGIGAGEYSIVIGLQTVNPQPGTMEASESMPRQKRRYDPQWISDASARLENSLKRQ